MKSVPQGGNLECARCAAATLNKAPGQRGAGERAGRESGSELNFSPAPLFLAVPEQILSRPSGAMVRSPVAPRATDRAAAEGHEGGQGPRHRAARSHNQDLISDLIVKFCLANDLVRSARLAGMQQRPAAAGVAAQQPRFPNARGRGWGRRAIACLRLKCRSCQWDCGQAVLQPVPPRWHSPILDTRTMT